MFPSITQENTLCRPVLHIMKKVFNIVFALVVLLLITASEVSEQKDNKTFPLFQVDLDKEPFERWRTIAEHFKGEVPLLHNVIAGEVKKALPEKALGLVEYVAGNLDRFLRAEFAQEIRGLAHYSGANLGDIVLINFMYELNAYKAGCTTILAQNSEGDVILARNLDYMWPDLLRNVTYMVDFKKSGTVVFTAMGFPGLVGAVQGMRPGAYAIDQDERDKGSWKENVFAFLIDLVRKNVTPMTILIREVLQSDMDFDQAAYKLQTTPQMAPGYFMIAGTQAGQGMVITRNRMNTADIWSLNKPKGKWYILETNFDHWGPAGDNRRKTAETHMNATGQDFRISDLYDVLSVPPVMNANTVFTSIMSPNHPEIMRQYSKIRFPATGFLEEKLEKNKRKLPKVQLIISKLKKIFQWFRH